MLVPGSGGRRGVSTGAREILDPGTRGISTGYEGY